MNNKIQKYSLYLLFYLSLASLGYYFFKLGLPDNYLFLSSESSTNFSLLYYLSSFLAMTSYFVGPWIVLPFCLFSFIYTFILVRRARKGDALIPFLMVAFFSTLTFLFAPSFLGEGLNSFYVNNFDIYFLYFSTLALVLIISYLVLRGGFLKSVKLLSKYIDSQMRSLFNNIKKIKDQTALVGISKKLTSPLPFLGKIKESSVNLKKKIGSLPEKVPAEAVREETQSITPILSEKSIASISVDTDKASSSEDVGNLPVDVVAEPSKSPSLKRSSPGKFFKSSDLINCISENVSHVQGDGPDKSYFDTIIRAIQNKLSEFKLDAKVINVLKGPVVDTFELELGSGVKVSKVTGLSDDIGLALNGAPIRIVYPMRGKSTIGVEVPRNPRDFIYLDEVLNSKAFNDSNLRLPIAMGKDAFGDVKVVDLAGMPHMLVAGATGAGKSVFINTLLVSLIIKMSPRQLKLVLIDPKQLELAIFQDLPHLMLPVITDPGSSAIALLWAVQEMDKRYSILKELGVKNIEGFNKKIKTCDQSLLWKINQYYEDTTDEGYELPYIVVVIDEFADLILSKSGKEIELNVNRLAAKARAAGIHLVVATQRPSTDVVTGVVKANFPTRVAFRVSTGHDSKTILDQYGAQKLLGKGDMLYKHGVDLIRMHSSFVDETEIEGLLEKLATIPKSYNEGALDFLENGGDEIEEPLDAGKQSYTSGTSDDPIYQQALEVVIEQGSASASMIQRRLRVGYNRAANLVEEMERNGVVGPAQGSKPRKVLARPE